MGIGAYRPTEMEAAAKKLHLGDRAAYDVVAAVRSGKFRISSTGS